MNVRDKSDVHSTSGNVRTNGAQKITDDNTTPLFIGLSKTIQINTDATRAKRARERITSYILKQTYFSMNDGNAIALKYFDLRTCAVW
jgi:hypothetical protein